MPNTNEEQALADAALVWWIGHRPVSYGEREHLANPTVNTATATESALAKCVATLLSLNHWEAD